MTLNELGWNDTFARSLAEPSTASQIPARVTREDRGLYLVLAEQGELSAEISGKLRYQAQSKSDFPAVGDWVAIEPRPGEQKATIHSVLPRTSAFTREDAGARTQQQVLAANIDVVFLVTGLDLDFNVRRIERYLAVAWDSGANPVIVLNKADVCGELDERLAEVESVALGVPVVVVSAATGQGMDALRAHVPSGATAAFLGMSGVGKSSLINFLLGEERQLVHAVREDDSRGRHTTTRRELFVVPGGGIVIDTPGMRELKLWTDEDGVERVFADIEALAEQCRFRDCGHESEPGCAVQQAIAAGELDASRLRSYWKLKRELEHLEARQNQTTRLLEKTRWKKIAELQKKIARDRNRGR